MSDAEAVHRLAIDGPMTLELFDMAERLTRADLEADPSLWVYVAAQLRINGQLKIGKRLRC